MSLSDLSQADSDDTWSSIPDLRSQRGTNRLRAGAEEPSGSKSPNEPKEPEEQPFDDDVAEMDTPAMPRRAELRRYRRLGKIIVLMLIWTVLAILLLMSTESVHQWAMVSVPAKDSSVLSVEPPLHRSFVSVTLTGPLEPEDTDALYSFKQGNAETLTVVVQNVQLDAEGKTLETKEISQQWKLNLAKPANFDAVKIIERTHQFEILNEPTVGDEWLVWVQFSSSLEQDAVPLQAIVNLTPITEMHGFIFALCTLSLFLLLVGFDIVHRTFGVMFISTLTLAISGMMGLRPPLAKIVDWIQPEQLLVIFAMTILVAVTMESGIFDYLAVLSFKVFNGHIWPPINTLIAITFVSTAIIDKVSMVLILGPLCLRLCEMMNVHPVPVLITIIIFTNIGSAATPFTDQTDSGFVSNPYFRENGLTTGELIIHMLPGILLVVVQTYLQVRLNFRNIRKIQFSFSPEVTRLRRIITTWKRAAMGISNYSKEEQTVRAALLSKIHRVRNRMNRIAVVDKPADDFQAQLAKLKAKYPIRNRVLLIKAMVAFGFALVLFLLNAIPQVNSLSLGWSALMGAMLLLILADMEEMDSILAHVQWCSLLFIGTYLVLGELFNQLGFFKYVGDLAEQTINNTHPDSRLAVAILLILWISGILSSVLDNKIVAARMLHVSIAVASEKQLPWHPLVYAVAFGCGLGSNGTIIATAANIVGVGLAEQHGYAFYFWYYVKIAFPIMVGNLIVASVYLILVFVAGSWD